MIKLVCQALSAEKSRRKMPGNSCSIFPQIPFKSPATRAVPGYTYGKLIGYKFDPAESIQIDSMNRFESPISGPKIQNSRTTRSLPDPEQPCLPLATLFDRCITPTSGGFPVSRSLVSLRYAHIHVGQSRYFWVTSISIYCRRV